MNNYENNLLKYLEIREYDEIQQIKKLISEIIYRIESQKVFIKHDDIINEFKNEEKRITKLIYNTFPKVNRWTNIALIVSVPFTVLGFSTGLPMVSSVGLSIAGLSKIASVYIKYLESKYKWIGFKSKNILSPQK